MAELDFTRQSDLIPADKIEATRVIIIGCGAIGSHVAETIAKMGIRSMEVYDDDTVESHNLPSQGFGIPDLGDSKVMVMERRLKEGYGCIVEANPILYTGQPLEADVVISAVDSMRGRKTIFDAVKRDKVAMFIDGRMGAEYGQVFAIEGESDSSLWYETMHMFEDDIALQAPCTSKATIYGATSIAAIIAAQLKSWITEGTVKQGVEVDMINLTMSAM